jgi:hypothetical protein
VKDSKKSPLEKVDPEDRLGLQALQVVKHIVESAIDMDLAGDGKAFTPVILLECGAVVASQPVKDSFALMDRLTALDAIFVAASNVQDQPLHPVRKGLVECGRNICKHALRVLDQGLNRVGDENLLQALKPFVGTRSAPVLWD